jgi:hypothetical protein
MTRAKSLLFNVTLLVRPGLEPKIARFDGPHGVSCGRGLNPRHGPLQHPVMPTYLGYHSIGALCFTLFVSCSLLDGFTFYLLYIVRI